LNKNINNNNKGNHNKSNHNKSNDNMENNSHSYKTAEPSRPESPVSLSWLWCTARKAPSRTNSTTTTTTTKANTIKTRTKTKKTTHILVRLLNPLCQKVQFLFSGGGAPLVELSRTNSTLSTTTTTMTSKQQRKQLTFL
jgi:hypothetical protein